MNAKYLFALALTTWVLSFGQQSFAQQTASTPDHWTLLGNSRADYTLDHDIVSINENVGHITALKFIIKQGTLTMHRCTVHFTNGDSEDVVFPDEINHSVKGLTMDIKDNNKTVDKVSFWYDTQDNSDKKSIVEIWAIK